jgi:sterol desaturase/sphingolipid hydroxylase (fatty acid hydroxylase superfamily)
VNSLSSLTHTAIDAGIGLVWLLVLFTVIESVFPRAEEKASHRARLKGLFFMVVSAPFVILTTELYGMLWVPLHITPLLPELAPAGLPRPLAVGIACVAACFVGDFFYYWAHRAQHRFFWRFHAVHHSVRGMSGVAAYHHASETLFKIGLYAVPLGFFTQDPFALPVIGSLLSLQGDYLHSPTWLNFGPLGRYLVDNRFHRVHHATEPALHDKNFGVFTTLWDSLFGTAYFPRADEWPEAGVADFPEPTSVWSYLFAPFTYRYRHQPKTSPLAGDAVPAAQDLVAP